MSKLYPWEVPYTILLLSPLLATILSLTYLSVKSGVDELLTIKEKFTSINRKIIFILIVTGYIFGNIIILTQLRNVIIFDGQYTALYLISIVINILCSWLITNWYYIKDGI